LGTSTGPLAWARANHATRSLWRRLFSKRSEKQLKEASRPGRDASFFGVSRGCAEGCACSDRLVRLGRVPENERKQLGYCTVEGRSAVAVLDCPPAALTI
jgi:hypothetical protein